MRMLTCYNNDAEKVRRFLWYGDVLMCVLIVNEMFA